MSAERGGGLLVLPSSDRRFESWPRISVLGQPCPARLPGIRARAPSPLSDRGLLWARNGRFGHLGACTQRGWGGACSNLQACASPCASRAPTLHEWPGDPPLPGLGPPAFCRQTVSVLRGRFSHSFPARLPTAARTGSQARAALHWGHRVAKADPGTQSPRRRGGGRIRLEWAPTPLPPARRPFQGPRGRPTYRIPGRG